MLHFCFFINILSETLICFEFRFHIEMNVEVPFTIYIFMFHLMPWMKVATVDRTTVQYILKADFKARQNTLYTSFFYIQCLGFFLQHFHKRHFTVLFYLMKSTFWDFCVVFLWYFLILENFVLFLHDLLFFPYLTWNCQLVLMEWLHLALWTHFPFPFILLLILIKFQS